MTRADDGVSAVGHARSLHDLPRDLLDRSGAEGTRWLALVRLRELERARPRLDRRGDPEALHDFRVALRRFRSVLRAYGDSLDASVRPARRRRLGTLAGLTGPPRDAEVHLAWVHDQAGRLPADERRGIAALEHRLRRERRRGQRRLRRELARHFDRDAPRIERRLRRASADPPGDGSSLPTRAVVAAAIHALVGAAREALRGVRSLRDPQRLHHARIAVKRLRYALEPLAQSGIAPARVRRTSATAVAELRALQDDLGQIHDAQVFGGWLADHAAERGTPAAAALGRLLTADAERAWAAVADRRRRARIGRLLRGVERSADSLRAPAPA